MIKNVILTLALVAAFIVAISMAEAIVEHSKQETVERITMPPMVQSADNESETESVYGPGTSYTVMAVRNMEYIVAGWLDEHTQIILLYHDMDESEVRMRSNQFFSSLGETAISTMPSPTM